MQPSGFEFADVSLFVLVSYFHDFGVIGCLLVFFVAGYLDEVGAFESEYFLEFVADY